MRKALIVLAALAVLVSAVSATWADTVIRVLIMDEQFNSVPDGAEKLTLLDKTDGRLLISHNKPYTGKIEVWKGERGLYLINEIPIEEYVKSVVKAETGRDWEMEALKAQAVVSRTYALNKKEQNGQMNFDITSSVLHQVYDGDTRDEMVSAAVEATRGEVLTYEGRLIEALFHSTCGGHTEDPAEVFGKALPYIRPTEAKCELSPMAEWARRIPVSEIEEALGLEDIKGISVKSNTLTGRVKEIEIESAGGVSVVKATDFRRLMGWRKVPSTDFRLDFTGGSLELEGKGYGHGVGLCQWSALEMAKEGKSYREILSFYYPGTAIVIHGNLGL
jgi:stage II sporulation protein D